MTTKECRRCKVIRPTSEFHRLRKAKDGLQSECKVCKQELNRIFRENNPTYATEYFKTPKGKEALYRAISVQATKNGTGIYCITNTITGKKYVGYSAKLYRREVEHRNTNRAHSIELKSDYRKYGWVSFTFEILEQLPIGTLPAQLQERERYYIQSFLEAGVELYNKTYNPNK